MISEEKIKVVFKIRFFSALCEHFHVCPFIIILYINKKTNVHNVIVTRMLGTSLKSAVEINFMNIHLLSVFSLKDAAATVETLVLLFTDLVTGRN